MTDLIVETLHPDSLTSPDRGSKSTPDCVLMGEVDIEFCRTNPVELAVREQLDGKLDLEKRDVDVNKSVIKCHGCRPLSDLHYPVRRNSARHGQ